MKFGIADVISPRMPSIILISNTQRAGSGPPNGLPTLGGMCSPPQIFAWMLSGSMSPKSVLHNEETHDTATH